MNTRLRDLITEYRSGEESISQSHAVQLIALLLQEVEDHKQIIDEMIKDKNKDTISASEALFGFCAWLTCRKEVIAMGASENCSPVVELIRAFIDENKLKEPREDYNKHYELPKEVEVPHTLDENLNDMAKL